MTKLKCINLTGAVSSNTYKTPKGNYYEFHKDIFTEIKDAEDALFFANSANFESKGALDKVISGLKKLVKKEKEISDKEEAAADEVAEAEATVDDEVKAADGDDGAVDGEEPSGELETEEEKKKRLLEENEALKKEGVLHDEYQGAPAAEVSEEEKERLVEYNKLLSDGMSEAEAKGTVWPEGETVADAPEGPSNEDGTPGKNIFTHEGLKELNSKEQTYLISQCTTEKVPRLEVDKIKLLLKLQTEGSDLLEIQKGYQA